MDTIIEPISKNTNSTTYRPLLFPPHLSKTLPDYLKNKVILITGAGDGIGRAVAIATAAAGAEVILLGKTTKKLEAVYDTITALGYKEPAIQPLNLLHLNPENADSLAQDILELFGRLDGLVHCAGHLGTLKPLALFPPHEWQEIMQVNLHAPFLLTQRLLPLLKKSTQGHIIFTTDTVARNHQAYFGAYAIAKAGIEAFAGILHEESEANTPLIIHTLYPGKIATRLRKRNYPDIDTSLLASPEAIAHAYVYLLSQAGVEFKGQALSC